MRRYPIPKIGEKLGGLEVLEVKPAAWGSGKRTRVVCRCSRCGEPFECDEKKARSGHTRSCCSHTRQGNLSRSLTYRSWQSMMQRCYKPNCRAYASYGAKGIRVWGPWHDFLTFLRDVGERPGLEYSIDRIRNNRGYEPGNVRWATRIGQMNNTSRSRFLRHDGQRMTLAQWCRLLNLPKSAVTARLNAGWSERDALTRPLRPDRRRKG